MIVSGAIGAVAAAVRIGRGSLAIATQSVVVGMGLSFAAMAAREKALGEPSPEPRSPGAEARRL